MKNVTITLDEETANWARVHAAQRDISVSRMISEMLQKLMRDTNEYDESMKRFLAKAPVKLKRGKSAYAQRDALHDRSRLR